MKIEIRVCDVDQAVGEPTKTYTIAVEGRSVEVDLCAEHAAPLEELLHLDTEEEREPAKPKPAARSTSTPKKRTSRTRPKIVSLEEIEAMKQ
ncbi:DNA binding protein [Streptomyces phage Lannister]|uniref:DNA binding protein n=1 Tax=Streptomyces phage Lannister TaxID=1674927 RepID=A0A0K1Y9F2_9CAUD|nr:DNA binding protein [Streptomyces phage Lannister]AKY03712.1 DNA binding protein [Streptomyces phage Lannister]